MASPNLVSEIHTKQLHKTAKSLPQCVFTCLQTRKFGFFGVKTDFLYSIDIVVDISSEYSGEELK